MKNNGTGDPRIVKTGAPRALAELEAELVRHLEEADSEVVQIAEGKADAASSKRRFGLIEEAIAANEAEAYPWRDPEGDGATVQGPIGVETGGETESLVTIRYDELVVPARVAAQVRPAVTAVWLIKELASADKDGDWNRAAAVADALADVFEIGAKRYLSAMKGTAAAPGMPREAPPGRLKAAAPLAAMRLAGAQETLKEARKKHDSWMP